MITYLRLYILMLYEIIHHIMMIYYCEECGVIKDHEVAEGIICFDCLREDTVINLARNTNEPIPSRYNFLRTFVAI